MKIPSPVGWVRNLARDDDCIAFDADWDNLSRRVCDMACNDSGRLKLVECWRDWCHRCWEGGLCPLSLQGDVVFHD